MKLRRRPLRTLAEAATARSLLANPRIGAGDLAMLGDSSNISPQEVNPVRDYEAFRRSCPDYHRIGHAAYCPRCDNFPTTIGGVTYQHNDPRDDLRADEISPVWPEP